MIWQWIFWICAFALVHTYLVYPALLKLFAGGLKLSPPPQPEPPLPRVAVIMAAYNEEKVIEAKIRSVFQSNYPAEKLEMWIGSDGSTDRTDAIVTTLRDEGLPIHFQNYGGRNGKSNILNRMLPEIDADILIPTDANILFTPETIPALVRHFSDDKVGLAGANILNTGMRKDGISQQEETYIRRENYMTYYEGVLWGTTMGAFGACYAIRRELFPVIPRNFLMEDFYITLHVISAGKKAIADLEAKAYEDVSNALEEEYKRKIRISAGNYQNLSVFYRMLFKPWTGAGFSFLSHKFLRWMGPFLLIIMFLCSALLFKKNLIWQLLFLLQLAGMLTPLLDTFFRRLNVHTFALRLVAYFYMMNLALLQGAFRYFGGVRSGTWNPTQRNINQ